MSFNRLENLALQILSAAGIEINGAHPWEIYPQMHAQISRRRSFIYIDRHPCWLRGAPLPGCCAGWRSARCHGCFCNVYLYFPLHACVAGIYGCVSLLHHDYCLSAPRIL